MENNNALVDSKFPPLYLIENLPEHEEHPSMMRFVPWSDHCRAIIVCSESTLIFIKPLEIKDGIYHIDYNRADHILDTRIKAEAYPVCFDETKTFIVDMTEMLTPFKIDLSKVSDQECSMLEIYDPESETYKEIAVPLVYDVDGEVHQIGYSSDISQFFYY
jgi:hypothetical protein